jgi:hypothetical protein
MFLSFVKKISFDFCEMFCVLRIKEVKTMKRLLIIVFCIMTGLLGCGKKKFTAQLTAQLIRSSDGHQIIEVFSNLPDGTLMGAYGWTVDGPEVNLDSAAANCTLQHGTCTISPLVSLKGNALSAGKYEFYVGTHDAILQPKSVQKVIGKEGELLDGPLVTPNNEVEYVFEVKL